jgi:hypothetical protein
MPPLSIIPQLAAKVMHEDVWNVSKTLLLALGATRDAKFSPFFSFEERAVVAPDMHAARSETDSCYLMKKKLGFAAFPDLARL